jgi:hypothetical protein
MNYMLICDRCEEPFDEEERLPLILSECGHTFCKRCVNELYEEDPRQCPLDGHRIREKNEKAFRKNIKILKMLAEGVPEPT